MRDFCTTACYYLALRVVMSILPLQNLEQAIDYQPLVVLHNSSIASVVQLMYQHQVDYALIFEQQVLVGIFTARDLTRIIAAQLELDETPIALVMTRQVVVLPISAIDDVAAVLATLRQHQIRYLPLVDAAKTVVGVLTPHRIRAALQPLDLLKLRQVSEVMATDVIVAAPTAPLLQVSQLMMAHRVSCVVITEPDALGRQFPIGILTERDMVRLQATNANWNQIIASHEMSQPLHTVKVNDSLWKTHHIMQENRIRRMVVINHDGYLAGIVTQSRVLKAIDPVALSETVLVLQQLVSKCTYNLQVTNHKLRSEVVARQQAEQSLKDLNQRLEELVQERAIAPTQAETRYQTLVEHTPDVILQFNRQGQVVFANTAVDRLWGIPLTDLLHHSLEDFQLISAVVVAHYRQAIQQVLATAQEVVIEIDHSTAQSPRWMQVRFVPQPDVAGAVETVLAIARDITTLKQAEADTQRALAREQELNALKDSFIATVSHEFRTPLTIIRMNLELLNQQYTDSSPTTQARITRTLSAVSSLTHLLDDFLSISMLMSGQYQPHPGPTNIASLCQELIEPYQSLDTPCLGSFQAQDERQAGVGDRDTFIHHVDAKLLRIVLSNLLSNAVKFSPAGGKITLTLSRTASAFILQLQDQGIGIPATDLPLIWQRFYRASNSSTIQGNGIGLAIVRCCLAGLPGTIAIDSQVGIGTTVTLHLPTHPTSPVDPNC